MSALSVAPVVPYEPKKSRRKKSLRGKKFDFLVIQTFFRSNCFNKFTSFTKINKTKFGTPQPLKCCVAGSNPAPPVPGGGNCPSMKPTKVTSKFTGISND